MPSERITLQIFPRISNFNFLLQLLLIILMKGVKDSLWLVHAFKNTLLPVITVFGVQIGIMFAFTLLTELVFQWPGMGFMFLEAVHRADLSLLIAYMVVVAALFVFVNTVVDILYGFINPTVRITGSK